MRKYILTAVLFILVWSTFSVFSIQPIGAIPDGATVIMFKPDRLLMQGKFDFLESVDHLQYKNSGEVTLLGRMMFLGIALKSSFVIVKLPYFETLELISNGGLTWR